MSLNYVSLTLDFYDGQGNPIRQGTAVLTPSGQLTDAIDHEIVTMAPITVTFNAQGVQVVSLLATDNANLLPSGWVWTATFANIPGDPPGFSFALPFAHGAQQFLSAQAPVQPVEQMTGFLQGAYPGDDTAFLNGVGEWTTPASGGGSGGAVATVNGETGNVVLTAADVGAWAATALAGPSTAHTTVWGLPGGELLVLPLSTYSLTGDDGTWITNAIGQLPTGVNGYPVGTIRFGSGTYTMATGLTPGPYVKLRGVPSGTIFKYTGTGKAIFAQDTTHQDTTFTAYRVSGSIEDIVVDISTAGSAATGIYLDSTNEYTFRCAVLGNAAGTTQQGVVIANDTHSLNSVYGYCHIRDCGTGLTFTRSGTGSASQERIDCKWKINCQNGQTGVSLLNGMQVQGSDIRVHLNLDQYAIAGFNFGWDATNGPSNFQDCHFITRVEPPGVGTGGWGTPTAPTVVAAKFANANSGWKDCTGILFVSPSMPSSATAGTLGKVVFGGTLANDAGLTSVQTAPNGWPAGGGSGGPVASVNGATGTVVLRAADVGADAAGSIVAPLDGPSSTHKTVWQLPDNTILVKPLSTYSLTGDDSVWINNALARLTAPGTAGPTTVKLMNDGNYTVKTAIGGTSWTYGTWLDLNGAVITYSGTVAGGAVINFQGNNSSGYPQGYPAGGAINGTIVNASTAATTGIRYGAGENFTFERIRVQGFSDSTGNSYGMVQTNANGWTEKSHVIASIMECDNGFYFLTPTGSAYTSHEYNVLQLHIRCYEHQNGVVMSGNGAYTSGSKIHVYGNFGQQANPGGATGAGSAIDLSAGGNMSNIWLCVEVETTGTGSVNWTTIKFGPASTGGSMNNSTGMLRFLGSNFTASDAVASQFSFGGTVNEFNSGASIGLRAVNSKPIGWL